MQHSFFVRIMSARLFRESSPASEVYDPAFAKLAWDRTLSFLKKALA